MSISSHSFYLQMPVSPGRTVSVVARDLNSGSTQLVTTPYVEVTWVQPSGVTWGPPNTFTAAGTARNGTGGVQLQWRDVTFSTTTTWNVVPWAPEQSLDATWSNTVPVTADCRSYQVKAIYSGVSSQVYSFRGNTAGYC